MKKSYFNLAVPFVVNEEKNAFTVQRAKRSDMNHIAKIISASADWYAEFVAEKDLQEHYVGDEWIEKNFFRRKFYTGKVGNEIVGTISTQTLGTHAYLGYIYLDTKQVGKGYGAKLIDFAKQESIAREHDSMVLIAHPQATWAIKAYEKYGFKRIKTDREEILAWQKGALVPYYEEGFHLYQYEL